MEQYVKKPAAVQVFALNGATDIILRKEEVTADFDSWWDYQPPREAEPVTASDRLDALEAAVYDLAEVVYNG